MPLHEINLKSSAVQDLDRIRRYDAVMIADGIEKFLTHDPMRLSRARIKRLRGLQNPDFRLRLGDFRVFYNVDEKALRVDVLRIIHKDETAQFYEEVQG